MTSPLTPSGVPLRLGVVSYLNAAPTVHGLDRDPGFRLIRDVPSRVADLLHAGEVDLGLIPSIEYAAGDYAIVPGVAIGSRGPVRSVSLFHRVPLEAVRRVALDVSSRTSVALARVLLHERLGRDPEYVPSAPSVPAMLAAADAALVIGDHALYFEGPGDRLDLGAEWTARTGLPFVFAFWAGRPGRVTAADVAALNAARDRAVASPEAVASAFYPNDAGVWGLATRYLRDNVKYDFTERGIHGATRFYREAAGLGLVPAFRDVRFY